MDYKKFQWLEAVGFFVAANVVMLTGSDFPPPVGFWKVTLAAFVLAVCQWVYTGVLLRQMAAHGFAKTFVPNLLLFVAAGIGTVLAFALLNGGLHEGGGLWLGMIAFCFAVYGAVFWTVNCLICRRWL